MDPAKIKGISNWPTPTSVKQIRSFLGFCNFYRPFIYHFSHIARPLNELTRKNIPWQWGQKQQTAFEKLRDRVTSEPVLAQPRLNDQFGVEVDASGFALGAVLMQRDDKGKRHPIAYFSTTLSEAERNYDIYDLEFLAIIRALRHWRPFVAGSPHKIIIFTDHANLQYWRQPQKISRRIAREVLELSEFDVELRHIPGKNNGRADALSRRPDYDQGEQDNENITVLPDGLFARAAQSQPQSLTYIADDPPQQNEDILRPWVDPHKLKKINGEWWKEKRKVVTGNDQVRKELIRDYHDLPAYGHPGISRTLDLISRYFWWPQIS
jgi:ribonuclease HI